LTQPCRVLGQLALELFDLAFKLLDLLAGLRKLVGRLQEQPI
jgi:hypothetical protein